MKYLITILACSLLGPQLLHAGEEDPLENRQFTNSLSETRNGTVVKKVIPDLIRFKNGKITSRFIHEKFGMKWLRYRIDRDTSYLDETKTLVRRLDVHAYATDENNLTVSLEFTVLEWDIDGVVKVTKNDRLRRYYDMAGREKGGKPKKKRTEKTKKVFFVKP